MRDQQPGELAPYRRNGKRCSAFIQQHPCQPRKPCIPL